MLGEAGKKPSGKPVKKPAQQKDKKPASAKYTTGGRWYTADPKKGGEYVGRYDGTKWINATPEEKAAEKQKATKKIGSTGVDAGLEKKKQKVSAALRGQQQTTSVPKKPGKFADQKLYDQFVKLLSGGNTQVLQAFIDKHQIKYNPDKDTFYVGVDSSGKKLSGDDRKIFGDSKSTRTLQKAIYDKLTKTGVSFGAATSTSPFSPDRIAPSNTSRTFDGKQNSDGSITFDGITYEALPEGDVDTFVQTQYEQWISTDGKNSSPAQQRQFKEQLTVAAFAISQRHRTLSILLEGQDGKGAEQVAVYDNDKSRGQFISSLQKAVAGSVEQSRQGTVNKLFTSLQKETDPKAAEQIMVKILSEIGSDESPIFRQSGVIPSIAENFTAILEMKRGRTVIVPLRSNFKASDVISLSGVQTSGSDAKSLVSQITSIYVGISVKFLEGGASSMGEKTRQSVFKPPFKKTRDALLVLSKAASEKGSLFDPDPTKKKVRQDEVKQVMAGRLKEIAKYYGITPEPKDADALIAFLKNGPPECVDGKVIPRRNRPSPLSKGVDKKGDPIDEQAWEMTFAMQASWDAIYNSNVIGQAFASQTWTKTGVVEVDGLTRQAKQVMQPFKEARGSGMQYQPDNLVSKNKPVSSTEDLRNGNPCGKTKE